MVTAEIARHGETDGDGELMTTIRRKFEGERGHLNEGRDLD